MSVEKLSLNWEPFWYCEDQEIVVGDQRHFYIDQGGFSHGRHLEKEEEILAEVLSITHSSLGAVKGIVAGLSYKIHLVDGQRIQVDSEENPGFIERGDVSVDNWCFTVEVAVLERTGLTWQDRVRITPHFNWTLWRRETEAKYRRLMGVESL